MDLSQYNIKYGIDHALTEYVLKYRYITGLYILSIGTLYLYCILVDNVTIITVPFIYYIHNLKWISIFLYLTTFIASFVLTELYF